MAYTTLLRLRIVVYEVENKMLVLMEGSMGAIGGVMVEIG